MIFNYYYAVIVTFERGDYLYAEGQPYIEAYRESFTSAAIQQYDYAISLLKWDYSHTPLYDAAVQKRLWAMTHG